MIRFARISVVLLVSDARCVAGTTGLPSQIRVSIVTRFLSEVLPWKA